MKTKLLILVVIILTTLSLKAQIEKELTDTNIIYNDYNPDIELVNLADSFSIDINKDGILDIKFYFIFDHSQWLYIRSLNSFFQYCFISDSYGDSLNNSILTWRTSATDWLYTYKIDKIGLKFIIDNNTYYGWLHGITEFNIDTYGPKLTVDKYAFCKIPNYPFLWGQTSITTGIVETKSLEKANVFVSEIGSSVVVNSDKKIEIITITNIAGEQVAKQTKVNANNKTIKTANFAKGTYIVKVQFADGGFYTQKVVL